MEITFFKPICVSSDSKLFTFHIHVDYNQLDAPFVYSNPNFKITVDACPTILPSAEKLNEILGS